MILVRLSISLGSGSRQDTGFRAPRTKTPTQARPRLLVAEAEAEAEAELDGALGRSYTLTSAGQPW